MMISTRRSPSIASVLEAELQGVSLEGTADTAPRRHPFDLQKELGVDPNKSPAEVMAARSRRNSPPHRRALFRREPHSSDHGWHPHPGKCLVEVPIII